MKKIITWLTILTISFIFSTPAWSGWKEKLAKNQIRAAVYIEKLRDGADPDRVTRPNLRRDERARAATANREIKKKMAQAEWYARQGRHDEIAEPEFDYKLVSERRLKELSKDILN